MAYALSTFTFRQQDRDWLIAVLLQRFLPPIAIVFPLVGLYHSVGLLDTRSGRGTCPCGTQPALRHFAAEILLR